MDNIEQQILLSTNVVREFWYSSVLRTRSNSTAGEDPRDNSTRPFLVSMILKVVILTVTESVSSGNLSDIMIVTTLIGSFSASVVE